MTNHLKDKVIVVTGAGSGFGQLVCEKVSAQGAQVVLADVNAQAITEIAANISQAGGVALAVTTDVTDLTQMQRLISQAKDQFSQLHNIWPSNNAFEERLVSPRKKLIQCLKVGNDMVSY